MLREIDLALHGKIKVHTRRMLDVIDGDPHVANDGLPESLAQAIAAYELRYFKLKLAGDVTADLARLSEIAALLDRAVHDYTVTLDGNEQYEDVKGIAELSGIECFQVNPLIKDYNGPACAYVANPFGGYQVNAAGQKIADVAQSVITAADLLK